MNAGRIAARGKMSHCDVASHAFFLRRKAMPQSQCDKLRFAPPHPTAQGCEVFGAVQDRRRLLRHIAFRDVCVLADYPCKRDKRLDGLAEVRQCERDTDAQHGHCRAEMPAQQIRNITFQGMNDSWNVADGLPDDAVVALRNVRNRQEHRHNGKQNEADSGQRENQLFLCELRDEQAN